MQTQKAYGAAGMHYSGELRIVSNARITGISSLFTQYFANLSASAMRRCTSSTPALAVLIAAYPDCDVFRIFDFVGYEMPASDLRHKISVVYQRER
jgi:hypothetical protein